MTKLKYINMLIMALDDEVSNGGLPPYVTEHKFHDKRRWRFDFAWPEYFLGMEIDGAVWQGGRHVTGAGFTKDCEKFNAATVLGWSVLRYPSGTSIGNIIEDIKLITMGGTK